MTHCRPRVLTCHPNLPLHRKFEKLLRSSIQSHNLARGDSILDSAVLRTSIVSGTSNASCTNAGHLQAPSECRKRSFQVSHVNGTYRHHLSVIPTSFQVRPIIWTRALTPSPKQCRSSSGCDRPSDPKASRNFDYPVCISRSLRFQRPMG
jgi:hypothetical protein